MKQIEAQKKLAHLTIAILVKIKLHKRDNPILSKSLEEEFSISGEKVREIIRILRREGQPIANSGGASEGYHYADTYDQLEPTILDLKSREDSLRVTRLAMMKKFGMNEGLFA